MAGKLEFDRGTLYPRNSIIVLDGQAGHVPAPLTKIEYRIIYPLLFEYPEGAPYEILCNSV
jgi:hypothetical protein